jgi:HK97 gp10 family phage protein
MTVQAFIKARAAVSVGTIEFNRKIGEKTLDKIAQSILTKAKKLAPVDTGALRASGRVKRVNQYQRIVQFGGSGTGVNYAQAVELGTYKQRPQPFLEPAVKAEAKNLRNIVKSDGQKVLRAMARAGSTLKV